MAARYENREDPGDEIAFSSHRSEVKAVSLLIRVHLSMINFGLYFFGSKAMPIKLCEDLQLLFSR